MQLHIRDEHGREPDPRAMKSPTTHGKLILLCDLFLCLLASCLRGANVELSITDFYVDLMEKAGVSYERNTGNLT